MKDMNADPRRQELGEFIRAHRERLNPQSLGIGTTGRRRTPGLRREEAAQLCGMSVTWYTFIEQGRDVSISPAALSRLAVGFHLNAAERAYLFELANRRDPVPGGEQADTGLPPALADCLAAITAPAYLLDRFWNVPLWNDPARTLFTGWLDREGDRNLLDFMFLSREARILIPDFEARARRIVAEFRADAGGHLTDADIIAFISRLEEASPLFKRLWHAHDVVAREGGKRHFLHPERGALSYVQSSFLVSTRPDLKLVILTQT